MTTNALIILSWMPFVSLLLIPAVVFVLFKAANHTYLQWSRERVSRVAVVTSFAILLVNHFGLALMSMQYAR